MPIDISKVRSGDRVRVAHTYGLPPTYVGDSTLDVYRCSRRGYVVERQWLGGEYEVLRVHDQIDVLVLAWPSTPGKTVAIGCSAIAEILPALAFPGLQGIGPGGIPVRWAGAEEMLTTYPEEVGAVQVRCDCGGDAVRLPHRDWCSVAEAERAAREEEIRLTYWRGV